MLGSWISHLERFGYDRVLDLTDRVVRLLAILLSGKTHARRVVGIVSLISDTSKLDRAISMPTKVKKIPSEVRVLGAMEAN